MLNHRSFKLIGFLNPYVLGKTSDYVFTKKSCYSDMLFEGVNGQLYVGYIQFSCSLYAAIQAVHLFCKDYLDKYVTIVCEFDIHELSPYDFADQNIQELLEGVIDNDETSIWNADRIQIPELDNYLRQEDC